MGKITITLPDRSLSEGEFLAVEEVDITGTRVRAHSLNEEQSKLLYHLAKLMEIVLRPVVK